MVATTFLDGLLLDIRANLATIVIVDTFAIWLIHKIYTSDKTAKANLFFSAFSLVFLVWVNGGFVFAFSTDLKFAEFIGKVILADVIWSFIFLYFFLSHFPTERGRSAKGDFLVLVSGSLLSLLVIFTDEIVKGSRFTQWGVDPVYAEQGRLIYYIYIATLIGSSLFQMLREYPRLNAVQKRKAQLLFFGLTIFLSANLVFNVYLPISSGSIKYWQFGNYSAVILIFLAAFAIATRQLLEVKVVATEVLTLAIWVTLVIRLLGSSSSFDVFVNVGVLVILIPFGILLVKSVKTEVEQRQELQKLTQKLRELDVRKDEFVSVAAHELRAPMTAIKGYISMILDGDVGEIPEKAKDFLGEAITANDRLIRMVNNMLDISRIEENRLVFEMGLMDLSEVVTTAYREYKVQAEQKGLDFRLHIEEGAKAMVNVDKDRIYEVTSNFISNAVKYTDKGTVVVSVLTPNPTTVRFEVVDTGPGISPEEQKKLFQKFYRTESNIGKKLGTGLGLYISKLLIERFGGRLGLSSEKGKGSMFWFELPLVLT